MRKLASSGSPLETEIGFSRAVRVGDLVCVSGTAPIGPDGATAGKDDLATQTRRCFTIAFEALRAVGAEPEQVIRTRIMLTDIERWREVAAIHGELFANARPAATFVEVSRFIDPDWLIEIEVDAVVSAETENLVPIDF